MPSPKAGDKVRVKAWVNSKYREREGIIVEIWPSVRYPIKVRFGADIWDWRRFNPDELEVIEDGKT